MKRLLIEILITLAAIYLLRGPAVTVAVALVFVAFVPVVSLACLTLNAFKRYRRTK